MTMNTHDARRSTLKAAGALAAGVLAVAGIGATAWAETAPVWNAKVEVPAGALSVGDIESRLVAQGIKVKEVEIRDLIAEVDAYDAQGREVELIIDRRNGETLSHKYDD
jgi:multidrug efflux pump subunit AcrA (membrane-fusion protein)